MGEKVKTLRSRVWEALADFFVPRVLPSALEDADFLRRGYSEVLQNKAKQGMQQQKDLT